MLTAFQSYCVKQAGAALLLAGLEKEKELLRIFLRVSQMENVVLRRMNLNSFLMVRFKFYLYFIIYFSNKVLCKTLFMFLICFINCI